MGGGRFLEAREKRGGIYVCIPPHPHPHPHTHTHTHLTLIGICRALHNYNISYNPGPLFETDAKSFCLLEFVIATCILPNGRLFPKAYVVQAWVKADINPYIVPPKNNDTENRPPKK